MNGTSPYSEQQCRTIAKKLDATTMEIRRNKSLISMYKALESSEDLGVTASHLAQRLISETNELNTRYATLLEKILQCSTNKEGIYSYSRN